MNYFKCDNMLPVQNSYFVGPLLSSRFNPASVDVGIMTFASSQGHGWSVQAGQQRLIT
jgi:hypothetical protein